MNALDRAREHHAAIRANVDDWYEGRIPFAEFETRASVLHDAARAEGPEVDAALGELLVAALPGRRAS